jgi:molybdopterin molybdotransferase
MISIDEALDRIVQNAGLQPTEILPLEQCLGQTLAQDVTADLDSPPFDKSLMDGFAVRSSDLLGGTGQLTRVGEILAGQVPTQPVGPGQAIQIMTGAPVPAGADAVVMVEKTQQEGSLVSIREPDLRPGMNIMPKALEFACGEKILSAGHRIGSPEAGLLASVGQTRVAVYRPISAAILSTGNEIVPPSQFPGPGEIRNSNAWTLHACVRGVGGQPQMLGIAADNIESLESKVTQGLAADLLILSGGVSAGKRDLVPQTLTKLGVECLFHGVAFKPGKPLWFGRHAGGLVFGLPGNPVSVLACFEVFLKTAIRTRLQDPSPKPSPWWLPLAEPFDYSTRRPTYHPARVAWTSSGPVVHPVSWHGSPDLLALTRASGLLIVPAGDGPYPAGTLFGFLPVRGDLG